MNLVSKNRQPDLDKKIFARFKYIEKNCDVLPKIDSGIPHTTRSNMHSINFLDKSPKSKSSQVWQTINFDDNHS